MMIREIPKTLSLFVSSKKLPLSTSMLSTFDTISHTMTTRYLRRLYSLTKRSHRHDSSSLLQSATTPSSSEIRQQFLDFFHARSHLHVPSTSLIDSNQHDLLFVNSGMCQFKRVFLSAEPAPTARAHNWQRCLRISDLQQVGPSPTHHTYFEMLGNWSLKQNGDGGYSQKEACQWAWQLLTDCYRIDPRHLFVTRFEASRGLDDDREAEEIWRAIGVPLERIVACRENFWQMAEIGPCGTCTEIFFSPTGQWRDAIELWNLVSISYKRDREGVLTALDERFIDTGMGFERLCAVVQGASSNYASDLFRPLFWRIRELASSRKPYGDLYGRADENGTDAAYRIVADHARAWTVAIADGLRPGPKSRQHSLRRLIRRAAMCWKANFEASCSNESHTDHTATALAQLATPVIDTLGSAYDSVFDAQSDALVRQVIFDEVMLFEQLLGKGRRHMRKLIRKAEPPLTDGGGGGVLPASIAWSLYHSGGLPEDVIANLAGELGLSIDVEGFRAEKLRQSAESRRVTLASEKRSDAIGAA